MSDTVRSLAELLAIFASGQNPHSITEQDIRDTIMSLSLETADLSLLPRSAVGLNIGRLWVDANKALRMTIGFIPQNWAVQAGLMAGAASLAATATIPGQSNVYSVTAKLAGAGGTLFTAGPPIYGARGATNAAGSLSASPVARRAARAQISGSGGITATPSSPITGAFSSAFSAAFKVSGFGIGVVQAASAKIDGGAAISANGTLITGQGWGAVAASITKSNGNLTITRTGGVAGIQSTALASQFKTSGKVYWEVALSGSAQTSEVGFGNPSQAVGDNTRLNGSTNSIEYYTYLAVGGLAIGGNWSQDLPAFTTSSVISFALDLDRGWWWTRVDGGTWVGAGNTPGDPVLGTNPITAICTTTGGLGPTAEFNTASQSQTMRIRQSQFQFSAPAGYLDWSGVGSTTHAFASAFSSAFS